MYIVLCTIPRLVKAIIYFSQKLCTCICHTYSLEAYITHIITQDNMNHKMHSVKKLLKYAVILSYEQCRRHSKS